jgi:hypothetical protein
MAATTYKCISGCGAAYVDDLNPSMTVPCACGRLAIAWSLTNTLRVDASGAATVPRRGNPVIVGQQSLFPEQVPSDTRSFPWSELVGE